MWAHRPEFSFPHRYGDRFHARTPHKAYAIFAFRTRFNRLISFSLYSLLFTFIFTFVAQRQLEIVADTFFFARCVNAILETNEREIYARKIQMKFSYSFPFSFLSPEMDGFERMKEETWQARKKES